MSEQEMNPEQILANLELGADRRDEAAEALPRLLQRLVCLPLTEARTGELYAIEPEDQPEIVDRAVMRVIERSPLPVVGKSDGECVNYLKQVLVRIFLDVMRKRQRSKEIALPSEQLDNLRNPRMPDEGADLREASEALLSRVVDGMCARARSEPECERFRRTWSQIHDLVFNDVDMRLILERDEGLGKEPSRAEVKTARDRVLTQHKRFRKRMRATVLRMVADGALSESEAQMIGNLIEKFLLRRQRRGVGSV